MQHLYDKIFEKTTCPSQDLLLKYQYGELSQKEMHFIEKHIIDCPVCNDFLEGIQQLSKTEYEKELNAIKKALGIRSKKRVFFRLIPYAAAILIIAIFTGTYFFLHKSHQKPNDMLAYQREEINQRAGQRTEKPVKYSEEESTASLQSFKNKKSDETVEIVIDANDGYDDNVIKSEASDDQSIDASTEEETSTGLVENTTVQPAARNAKSSGQEPVTVQPKSDYEYVEMNNADKNSSFLDGFFSNRKNQKSGKKTVQQESVPATTQKGEKEKTNDDLVGGTSQHETLQMLFNKGNYLDCYFSAIQKEKTEDLQTNEFYYTGISAFHLEKNKEGIRYLSAFLLAGSAHYECDALWHLGLLYIKENQIDKANFILKQLQEKCDTYNGKADSLRTNLKFQ